MRRPYWFLFLLLMGGLFFVFQNGKANADSEGGPALGKADSGPPVIPSMLLRDLSGRPVNTGGFSGHPLLILNFLAPWCHPCLKEIPSLLHLSERSGGRVTVQGIVEGPVEPGDLKRFALKFRHRLPLARDPSLVFSHALGVHGLPTSFLVDSKGHIVSRVTGAVDWNDPRVRRYLKGFTSSKAGF